MHRSVESRRLRALVPQSELACSTAEILVEPKQRGSRNSGGGANGGAGSDSIMRAVLMRCMPGTSGLDLQTSLDIHGMIIMRTVAGLRPLPSPTRMSEAYAF